MLWRWIVLIERVTRRIQAVHWHNTVRKGSNRRVIAYATGCWQSTTASAICAGVKLAQLAGK